MIQVEKSVELIPMLKNRRAGFKYPWMEMKKGDSFIVTGYSYAKQSKLSTLGILYAKRHDPAVKFVTRKDGDNIRVFRIE